VKDLILPGLPLHDVDIELRVDDGRLEIERVAATDQAQGIVTGTLVLAPIGKKFGLRTQFQLHGIRPNLNNPGIDPESLPPIDIDVSITATGSTLHEFAASADGRLQIVVEQGEIDKSIMDLLASDLLVEIVRTLNPFSVKDKSTQIQCAVLGVNLKDGFARIEPLAIQTDKVTMLGTGEIDLGTEKLNLDWVSKPRKGLGLSATMITNPYIKLGGTLSDPSLEFKELRAVASTGVAVATLGLSLVARGMIDRITADQDVCQKALDRIEKRTNMGATR